MPGGGGGVASRGVPPIPTNHQSTASWGLRPAGSLAPLAPERFALFPPRHPLKGMRLRRIDCALLSCAHHQLTDPIFHPNRPSNRKLPIALQREQAVSAGATGEGSSPLERPFLPHRKVADAPIRIPREGGRGKNTHVIRPPVAISHPEKLHPYACVSSTHSSVGVTTNLLLRKRLKHIFVNSRLSLSGGIPC